CHFAGNALLCAHDYRASVRHASGPVACRTGQGHRDKDPGLHFMITDPEGTVLAMFVAFCRIGACFMVLPGFSSARIPVLFRLLMAAAISMAILPMLWDTIYPKVSGSDYAYIYLIIGELLVGTMYGIIPRFYVLGLQFAGSAISMSIGFN